MVKYVFLALMLLIMALGGARAGDAFLSFIGKKLRVRVAYKNHSGFLSCFILRFIELDKPTFTLKDFDLTLGCRKAYIEPNFGKLLAEKAIILKCTLESPSFLGIEAKGDLSVLFDKISSDTYDTIYAELIIYNDRVRFPFFTADSKDIKLYASGSMTKKGDVNLILKAFFSPKVAAQIPESLSEMLTQESNGWISYRLHVESAKDTPFLKLESDRLRLDFKRIEVQ